MNPAIVLRVAPQQGRFVKDATVTAINIALIAIGQALFGPYTS